MYYQNIKDIEKICSLHWHTFDAFVALSSFDFIKKGRHSEARVFEMVYSHQCCKIGTKLLLIIELNRLHTIDYIIDSSRLHSLQYMFIHM